jgi:hypothetical protein
VAVVANAVPDAGGSWGGCSAAVWVTQVTILSPLNQVLGSALTSAAIPMTAKTSRVRSIILFMYRVSFVMRGWRGGDSFAFQATARSNMPGKSN